MTPEQIVAFRAALLAETDPELVGYRTNGQTPLIHAWYNQQATPDYWVWRTNVQRREIYHSTGPEGSIFNWTIFKAQSLTEQGAWREMFMGDEADFSLPNLRAGIANIFSGSAQQNAQRDHCLAIGRKRASRIEKLFAVGAGSTASPATATPLSFTESDINQALNNA